MPNHAALDLMKTRKTCQHPKLRVVNGSLNEYWSGIACSPLPCSTRDSEKPSPSSLWTLPKEQKGRDDIKGILSLSTVRVRDSVGLKGVVYSRGARLTLGFEPDPDPEPDLQGQQQW